MKIKPFVLFVALLLSLTLLAGKTLAQAQGVPTMPKYFDPKNPENASNGTIINYDHAIVLTKKDAQENGGVTTVVSQGALVNIRLYVPFIIQAPGGESARTPDDDYWNIPNEMFCNYWTYQLNNNSLNDITGIPLNLIVPPPELKLGDTSKTATDYYFIASAIEYPRDVPSPLGETTITFTREANSLLHKKAQTLTFHINVVEASAAPTPAAPAGDESSSGNNGE